MKRLAGYIRVSTAPQAKKFGPAVQEQMERDYCHRVGAEFVGPFVDTITGKVAERRGFEQVLELGRQGAIDGVVAFRVSRVGRLVDVSHALAREILSVGLELHTPDKGLWDFDNPTDEFLYHVQSAVAQYDHRQLVENLYLGKIQLARSGRVPGHWHPYGRRWRWLEDGTKVIEEDPERASWIRWMFQAFDEGMGTHQIAVVLNRSAPPALMGGRWNACAVRRVLESESYAGTLRWKWRRGKEPTTTVIQVPPLVSRELFDRVQVRLATAKRGGRAASRTDRFPLIGLILCGYCGWRASLNNGHPRYPYFRCQNISCDGFGLIRYDRALEMAERLVSAVREDPEMHVEIPPAPTPAPPSPASIKESYKRRRMKLVKLHEMDLLPLEDLQTRLKELKREEEAELAALAQVTPARVDPAPVLELLRQADIPAPDVLRRAGVMMVVWKDKATLRFGK